MNRRASGGLLVSMSAKHVMVLGLSLLAVAAILRYLHTGPLPWWSVLRRWFDMDAEPTLPTWFSSILLFVTAQTAWYCACAESGGAARAWRNGWTAIGGAFLYLSIDEVAMLHEGLGEWFIRAFSLNLELVDGVIFHWWLLLFLPAILLVAVYMAWFLWVRCSRRPRLLAVGGVGLVSWCLALGLEFVAGIARVTSTTRWHLAGWEEFLELAGTICFLTAFLRYATTLPAQRGGEPALP
jgi:hypothetical protein